MGRRLREGDSKRLWSKRACRRRDDGKDCSGDQTMERGGESRLKDTRGGWTIKQDVDTEEGAFKLGSPRGPQRDSHPQSPMSFAVVTNMGIQGNYTWAPGSGSPRGKRRPRPGFGLECQWRIKHDQLQGY